MKIVHITPEEQEKLLTLVSLVAAGNTEMSDLEREAETLMQNIEKPREELADALREFRNATIRLNEKWDLYSGFAGRLSTYYPFSKSFDEVAYDVANWAKYHIEALDPPPDEDAPVQQAAAPVQPPAPVPFADVQLASDDDIPF